MVSNNFRHVFRPKKYFSEFWPKPIGPYENSRKSRKTARWIFFRTENCRKSSENIARVARKSFRGFLFFLKMSHFFRFLAHRVLTHKNKMTKTFSIFHLFHGKVESIFNLCGTHLEIQYHNVVIPQFYHTP